MPSGRGAFIERMKAMMATPARPVLRVISPEEALAAELIARHGERALLIEARSGADGASKLVAVLDLDPADLEAARSAVTAARVSSVSATGPGGSAPGGLAVEVIDRATWLMMRRLAAVGLLHFVNEPRVLYRAATFDEDHAAAKSAAATGGVEEASDAAAEERRHVMTLFGQLTEEADRTLRKARLLASGGFPEDAPPLLLKAVEKAATACAVGRGNHRVVAGGGQPAGLA